MKKSTNLCHETNEKSFSKSATNDEAQSICLDDMDRKILVLLQLNSRLSLRKLASMLHISTISASKRIRKLECGGLIKGYSVVLNPVKLGYDLTAVIFIQIEGEYLEVLAQDLSKIDNIISVYHITGEFDIVAIARLKDKASLNILIKGLLVAPHIKKTMTNITLDIVKEDFKGLE